MESTVDNKNESPEESLIGNDHTVCEYLTFMMGGEEYGVDILSVQEIRGWEPVTPIPKTPEFIKGVINLRGTVVPVVDLRQRFKFDSVEYHQLTVVIVLKVESAERSRVMGIVVDAVSDVYQVKECDIKEPPDFGATVSSEFITGLVTVNEKMIIVLDTNHLLSIEELSKVDLSEVNDISSVASSD